jgi:hypothetical protein
VSSISPRPVTTVALVVLSLAGCATTASSTGQSSPSASSPASGSPPSMLPSTATDRLHRLADSLTPRPGDAKDPSAYPYTVLRIQRWSRATDSVTRTDETWWRAIDGTGESHVRRLPNRPDLTRMPSGEEQRELARASANTDRYPEPGRLAMTFTEPIPADQATLTTRLFEHQPAETGPQALLWSVCDLAGNHYLNQEVRASTLRILAGINSLTYTGVADDIAGRTGWWFRLDTPGNRDIVAVDPYSGRLLVCSQNLTNTPPALFSYTLYLDADRVTRPAEQAARLSGHPAPVNQLDEGKARDSGPGAV